jgi:lysophospholipase L1-like esterase
MAYTRTTWKDKIVDLSGNIVQQGTPISAEKLNNIEQEIVNHESQLAEKTQEYLKNIGNDYLAHYRNTKYPKVVFWGDSITDGTGSTNWYSCYVYQFMEAIQASKGFYGLGYRSVNDPGLYGGALPANWTYQANGLNHNRLISTSTSADMVILTHPLSNRKVDVIYSTETDGGNFDVYINNVLVETVSCNGVHKYANKKTYTIPVTQAFKIKPHTTADKVYIEGFNWYGYNGANDGVLIHKVGHGGDYAENFADDEIVASISTFSPDLTVIAHLTNDYGHQTPELYRQKITTAILEAKKTGDVVLMIQCRGRLAVENPPAITYDAYIDVLYDLAKQHNCGVINVDSYFGGFTKASNASIFIDDIHLNQNGHNKVTELLLSTLAPYADFYGRTKVLDYGGGMANYGMSKQNFNDMLGTLICEISRYASGSSFALYDADASVKLAQIFRYIYNKVYFSSPTTMMFDTEQSDKFNNPAEFKQIIKADSGIILSGISASNATYNTIFIDSADGLLKYKNVGGVVKIITTT